LAQNRTAHATKADQIVQVDDRAPAKTKGFAASIPPSPELQADVARASNPATIHSEDVLTMVQLDPELLADSGEVNSATIHSDLAEIVLGTLTPGLELQADDGRALNPATIHSELDDTVTRSLEPVLALNLASLHPIVLDMDDTPAALFPHREEFDDIHAKMLSPTGPELDHDDATGWKLAPFYGLALIFLVAIVFSRQGILHVFQRDPFRQPPKP
jgi:hypothetical protein